MKDGKVQANRQVGKHTQKGDGGQVGGKEWKDGEGQVIKTAIKYVSVDCGIEGKWRVPAAHLRLAA